MKCSSYFYWELVTLIDVMLLGHWIEMRSVRQACGALIMSNQHGGCRGQRATAAEGEERILIG